jgi:hypothetical protein
VKNSSAAAHHNAPIPSDYHNKSEATMNAKLHLFEDIFPDNAEAHLPAGPARMVFVVHGSVVIGGDMIGEGETWHATGSSGRVTAGQTGATLWRWEFAREGAPAAGFGSGIRSIAKLAAALETLPGGPLLLRGDSVAFPPGGCALTHVHQGPGIRCLVEGGIRIDTHGRSTSYGPGGAWYESGPDPVFAQAAADRDSRFVRVMILPRALVGKSSIRYVDPKDAEKPKSQSYKVFVDAPIE